MKSKFNMKKENWKDIDKKIIKKTENKEEHVTNKNGKMNKKR